MASDPDIAPPAHWQHHTTTKQANTQATSSICYPYSPSIASTASSSCESVFSIDAPSSQSSEASSDAWSNSDRTSWLENVYALDHDPAQQDAQVVAATNELDSTHSTQQSTAGIAGISRQHPRRTQRLSSYESQYPRPPPSLVRQSERKDSFVDSLVDTTTQMIEIIWPLSVISCSRDATACGKQQTMLGLRTFVQEVLRRSKTSYSTLQVALYYLILIQSCIPKHDFTMEQSEDSVACRAMQCGRRMFLAALILASKYLQDRNYSCRAWSKISGLRTCEINANEMAFLTAVNWKLHIPEPVFHRWTDIVLKYSPSAQVNASSRSHSVPLHPWKAVVPLLTPELDSQLFGSARVSHDSGYNSPGSEISAMSPPPVPVRDVSPPSVSNEPTPTNSYAIPRTLETLPHDGKAGEYAMPTLHHLGPLPTPQLTPQTGVFCTPAVSAHGISSGRSMSHAMAQVHKSCLSRSTMDSPYRWKSHGPPAIPTLSRRSSLARSVSSASSPESMISHVTSRSSRSSSISSVASSNCALPPPNMAVPAARRCANMNLYGLKEENQKPMPINDQEAFQSNFAHVGDVDGMYAKSCLHDVTPRGYHPFEVRSNEETREAAAALHTLHLDRQLPPLQPQAIPRPSQAGRKRARPHSMDLSIQSCVREEITPRCLGDITNKPQSLDASREKDCIVLPDPKVADSYLVSKRWHPRPPSSSSSSSNIKPALSGECLPNKRACAGSDRGGRGEARLIMQNLKFQGPGMWDGILD